MRSAKVPSGFSMTERVSWEGSQETQRLSSTGFTNPTQTRPASLPMILVLAKSKLVAVCYLDFVLMEKPKQRTH